MKKDVIRKISAVLFFLWGLLSVVQVFLSLLQIKYHHGDIGYAIGVARNGVFACANIGLAVSVWFNKRLVSRISALAVTAVWVIMFIYDLYELRSIGDGFLKIYQIFAILSALLSALSYLLLFFAVSVQKNAFILSCCSVVCSMAGDVLPTLYWGGEFFHLEAFVAALLILLEAFVAALPILLWSVSQRKPRAPKLAEGATAGDALEALEKLNELRQLGELSEEEFTAKKAELLKKL